MTDELRDAPEYIVVWKLSFAMNALAIEHDFGTKCLHYLFSRPIDYAHRALRTAKLVFDDGDWVGATNRAYYAIFYAANVVLKWEGLQRSKHSNVMGVFRQKYVKTGMIEVEFSDIYGQAFDSRNEGDYERPKFQNPRQAEEALIGAQCFVERIEKLLQELK